MRDYELVFIFEASMDEDAVNAKLERFHELVTGGDAEIKAVDHWGNRQFAYPIKNKNSGYYVVSQFCADATSLPELERILKLDEQVLRYLVVLNEGEPSSGMSVLAAGAHTSRPESSEDADDREAEEEGLPADGDDESGSRMSPPEFSGGRGRRRRVDGPPIEILNYKDVSTLSRFITEQGKLLPRRTTKVAAGFQRKLSRAVKRARFLSLLPYVRSHEG